MTVTKTIMRKMKKIKVHEEEKYKTISVNKLDNINIMRNFLDNEFKIPADNSYKNRSENALSINTKTNLNKSTNHLNHRIGK